MKHPVAAAALVPLIAQGRGDDVDIGSILGYIVIGAIIGIVARLIIPGTGGMGWLLTIVVGIVGAVVGGWLAGEIFAETEGVDWIASIIVAAVLVWLVTQLGAGRRRTY